MSHSVAVEKYYCMSCARMCVSKNSSGVGCLGCELCSRCCECPKELDSSQSNVVRLHKQERKIYVQTYRQAEREFFRILTQQRQRFSIRRAERIQTLYRRMERMAYA